jgi:hypothetical protein
MTHGIQMTGANLNNSAMMFCQFDDFGARFDDDDSTSFWIAHP